MGAPATAADLARHRQLIREQEQSDLSQEEFCRQRGVSLHAFRVWKYRGAARSVRPAEKVAESLRLVPVRLVGGADGRIELSVAGGRTIRVEPGFDEATLRRLIAVLETPAC